jgi:hypothetical protein
LTRETAIRNLTPGNALELNRLNGLSLFIAKAQETVNFDRQSVRRSNVSNGPDKAVRTERG